MGDGAYLLVALDLLGFQVQILDQSAVIIREHLLHFLHFDDLLSDHLDCVPDGVTMERDVLLCLHQLLPQALVLLADLPVTSTDAQDDPDEGHPEEEAEYPRPAVPDVFHNTNIPIVTIANTAPIAS